MMECGNKFPWSNFHELNLNWILETVSKLEIKTAELTKLVNDFVTTAYGISAVLSPYDSITDYTQAELQALYDGGTNIIVSKNAQTNPYNLLWIITRQGENYNLTQYQPDTSSAVLSINGKTGNAILTGEDININSDTNMTITNNLQNLINKQQLLINNSFAQGYLVNTRNKWSGNNTTAEYYINYWKFEPNGGNLIMSLKPKFMNITNLSTTASYVFYQILEKPAPGEYTAVVCENGVYYNNIFTINEASSGVIVPKTKLGKINLQIFINQENLLLYEFIVDADTNTDLYSCDLYPGNVDLTYHYYTPYYATYDACKRTYLSHNFFVSPCVIYQNSAYLVLSNYENIIFNDTPNINADNPKVAIYTPNSVELPLSTLRCSKDGLITGVINSETLYTEIGYMLLNQCEISCER